MEAWVRRQPPGKRLTLTCGRRSVPGAAPVHLAPAGRHALPRLTLPVDDLRVDLPVEPPPLIKGWLQCGGRAPGPPAWDPYFGTAGLPMMMQLDGLPAAYRRRFLRG